MKCLKCQHENPSDAKFCIECASPMEFHCPNCGAMTPATGKFCKECAYDLRKTKEAPPIEPAPKELSLDDKITKIQKYLPKGLTEKILAQRDRIEGERKQVTVMFCDMEGFTQLSERLGPEEVYSIMDEIYEILIHKVHDYEGTVNEMTGDGIMALFGAPIALEDAPQRAIRSAMAIHREMSKFSDRMKEERENMPPLKMRVGIHVGPVVVGTLGNDLRVEFKAVGDTVNLASRVEGLAQPGTTYVTDDTFKLTEGFFRFESLGEKKVKGKEASVKVYRVIAPSTRRTRFDISTERGLTPLEGRERELELLLDGFERAKGARGQAFSIVSEAGVGKSRILYEFRKAIASEDAMFLEGRCFSYSRGVAYHPLIDILKANFDIREGDVDSEIRKKVIKGLKILNVEEALTLPYFLELLSVKDSGINRIPISPETKKDRIIEAYKLITLKGSEIRPLVVAFEDLHWVDKSSEDVLKQVLESIPGARVLMIFTYRPEFVHTWGGRSYHSQITLNRLSNRESLSMVNNLLGTEHCDRDLEELILEKTEGVPLFIEEFLRSLKDLKMIERIDSTYRLAKDIQEVTIPSTIHDVIMARVDSLPEGAKGVLQAGSVIEREFSYELIKRLMDLPQQDLLSHLSVLKDSELLYERGIYPQSSYIFKHALTQEVVCGSILARKKKQLHSEIGNAIEELHKDDIDEHYEVLAEHYMESENYEKGAEYSKLAAKKAERAGSFKEAIAHAKSRVLCLEKLPKTDGTKKGIIDARVLLSGYYLSLGHLSEAHDTVADLPDIAIHLNYEKRLPGIYMPIGLYNLWYEENYSKSYGYLNQVLQISEKTGDFFSLWLTCYNLGWCLSWNCEFVKSLEYFKKCLEMSIAANSLRGMVSSKSTMSIFNYAMQGRINTAYKTSRDSLSLAEESGDVSVKAFAYPAYGAACYYKGVFNEAEKYLLKGFSFCQKTTQAAWGTNTSAWLGELYADIGEHKKAQDYYKKSAEILLEHGRFNPSWINTSSIAIARSKVLSNERDIDLNKVYEHYEKSKMKVVKSWGRRYVAEILLNVDVEYRSDAENWIHKAIEADRENGMMWHLGRDYALYADLLKRMGDQSKAKENLAKALEIFKECGADGWVKKYEKELASLS